MDKNNLTVSEHIPDDLDKIGQQIEEFHLQIFNLKNAPDNGSALTISHNILESLPYFLDDLNKYLYGAKCLACGDQQVVDSGGQGVNIPCPDCLPKNKYF